MKLTKTHESLILLIILGLSFIFWNSIVLLPFKLLSVIFHESSHIIAAYCTGGSVASVEITEKLGGITNISKGNEVIVLVSGYTGSILWGLIIYLFSLNKKSARYILASISIFFILFGLIFIRNNFGIAAAVILSLTFAGCAFITNKPALSIILKSVSLLNIFYVIYDVIYDTFFTTNLYSDAARLEQITGTNAELWGIGWVFVAVCVVLLISKDIFNLKKKKKD